MSATDTSKPDEPKRPARLRSGESEPGGSTPRPRDPKPGRPAVGRYDGRSHNTRLPGEGLAKPPASSNTTDFTVVAAVEDPWGNGRERVYATVNRRVDVLEDERSHRLISEAAYRTGRQVQAVFELAARIGGSNWAGSNRVDPRHAQRGAIARAMERADEILAMQTRIRDRLGAIDTRLLERVLRDRMSYADCAALVGKGGTWGERFVKARFRDALEDLAEAWTAKGKAQPVPDDKHRAAAAGASERQAASVAGGVTAQRRAAEEAADAAARSSRPASARRTPGARGR